MALALLHHPVSPPGHSGTLLAKTGLEKVGGVSRKFFKIRLHWFLHWLIQVIHVEKFLRTGRTRSLELPFHMFRFLPPAGESSAIGVYFRGIVLSVTLVQHRCIVVDRGGIGTVLRMSITLDANMLYCGLRWHWYCIVDRGEIGIVL